jgi:hypothetical protein
MKILNFLNNYRYYRNPCLEFDKNFFLFSKTFFKLDYWTYWPRGNNTKLSVKNFFIYNFRRIRRLEILFKYSGSLIEFCFFKKLIKIFNKFSDDSFYGKCDFTNREGTGALQKRLDQNSFLSDIFLIVLSLIPLLSSVRKDDRCLVFWICIRRYNSVIIIWASEDFFNMFLVLVRLRETFRFLRRSFIKISFTSELESILVYSHLKSSIENIKKSG